MKKSYGNKDIYKLVANKLRQDGERIRIKCEKGGYRSYHKLLYSQVIVRIVLKAFFCVVEDILSEGDGVRIYSYFKLWPEFKESKRVYCPTNRTFYDTLPQFRPRFKFYKRIKEACDNVEGTR